MNTPDTGRNGLDGAPHPDVMRAAGEELTSAYEAALALMHERRAALEAIADHLAAHLAAPTAVVRQAIERHPPDRARPPQGGG